MARTIALCNGSGFLVRFATAQGHQTSQPRQHPGEEHSTSIGEDRSYWQVDWVALLPSNGRHRRLDAALDQEHQSDDTTGEARDVGVVLLDSCIFCQI